MAEIWRSVLVLAAYKEFMASSKSRMSYAVALTVTSVRLHSPTTAAGSRLSCTAKEFVPQGNKRGQSSSGSSYPITKRQPQEHVSPTATKLRISPAPMLMVVAPPPSARLGSPLPLEWRKTGLRTFNGVNSMSIHPHAQKKRSSHRNGCVYCLHNGESADLAESHVMRHPLTKEIICPVLKEKPCKCPLDISPHTVDACPMHFGVITGNKRMNVSRKVQPRLATVV